MVIEQAENAVWVVKHLVTLNDYKQVKQWNEKTLKTKNFPHFNKIL